MKPILFKLCKKKGLVDSEFKVPTSDKEPSDKEKLKLGIVIYRLCDIGVLNGVVLNSDELKPYEEQTVRDIINILSPYSDWDECFNDMGLFSELTPRMKQVLFFIPHYTTEEIAKRLRVGINNIKKLRQEIRDRTNYHKEDELIAFIRRLDDLGIDTKPRKRLARSKTRPLQKNLTKK